eukprot:TRINITY_DN98446_c0_g1_i1.p1 TRINITY_DN98446_c0_g1~~TRINITY_DN98446_c0_g1_i1.p1  ORF type:complete len:293 (+),score=48.42 TRINITY_DN98446_c0_g1_i1:36-881(+)
MTTLSAAAPSAVGGSRLSAAPPVPRSQLSSVAPPPGVSRSRLSAVPPSVGTSAVSTVVPSRSMPALPSLSEAEQENYKARLSAAMARMNNRWETTYGSMSLFYKKDRDPRWESARDLTSPLADAVEEAPKKPKFKPPREWNDFSEYGFQYKDHKAPKPPLVCPEKKYIPRKSEVLKGREIRKLHEFQIAEARRKEKNRIDGCASELNPGPLTAPLKPPGSEVHYNYVGGPPPSLWRSDYRGNLTENVHSKTTNNRYDQPNALAAVADPVSCWPGCVGHPDM